MAVLCGQHQRARMRLDTRHPQALRLVGLKDRIGRLYRLGVAHLNRQPGSERSSSRSDITLASTAAACDSVVARIIRSSARFQ